MHKETKIKNYVVGHTDNSDVLAAPVGPARPPCGGGRADARHAVSLGRRPAPGLWRWSVCARGFEHLRGRTQPQSSRRTSNAIEERMTAHSEVDEASAGQILPDAVVSWINWGTNPRDPFA